VVDTCLLTLPYYLDFDAFALVDAVGFVAVDIDNSVAVDFLEPMLAGKLILHWCDLVDNT